ncbi:hypothetical protein DERF_001057 [Dermatophagoides farinae]|uniref:Protein tincar-like n=1 Tax=Dermatophagoides farinae TaxID=6954 RepID=A0A922IA51_DERFA|nr:hypothetical protein DERF_001057 [Dermatophagoides farinae]
MTIIGTKSPPKSSIIKQFWQNYSFNNLASLWYSVLITCLQIYIIVRAINRFSGYISLPWPNNDDGGQAPRDSINFYLFFIASSILIIPFFMIVSLMKIGNYPNDGRKLGHFDIRKCLHYLATNDDDDDETNHKWYRTLWKHSLPIGPILHLIMAMCLLFPRLITEAQLIRHGFLSKTNIWKTDFDFILKHFDDGKIYFNFFGLIQTINKTEQNSLLLFSDTATTLIGRYYMKNSHIFSNDYGTIMSPEMINIIIALLMITAKYSSVFWRINKQFSAILTFQLLLNSMQSLIAINTFEIGFKIFICDPTHMLIRFRESSSLSLMQLTLLTILYLATLQLSSVSLYCYGLLKYREYRYARTKYFQQKYENYLMVNLLPYLFALIFFIMMAITVGPLFYEYTIIYSGSLNIGALLMLIATIIYFLCWILMWILLATKTRWNFYYDDLENVDGDDPMANNNSSNNSSLLITNDGKIFKIKDNLATMAIVNFIQANGFEKNGHYININGCESLQQQHQRMTTTTKDSKLKSALKINHHHHHHHGTLSKNFRFSTNQRNVTDSSQTSYETLEKRINFDDREDSDSSDSGEYTTFHRLKRTYSFNPNTTRVKQMRNHHNETTATTNVAYGIMGNNPSNGNNRKIDSMKKNSHDQISDISSGFHSDGSNSLHCSLLVDDDTTTTTTMTQSAAERPTIRSISPMQKTSNLLLNQMFHHHHHHHDGNVKTKNILSTFKHPPSTVPATTIESSKLIEFTENPDYSKYYLPQL